MTTKSIENEKKLIKDFLDFGTANGFGDLSMLVPWLFKAEASHSHLIEEVEKLPTTKDFFVLKSDLISLLKRKGL